MSGRRLAAVLMLVLAVPALGGPLAGEAAAARSPEDLLDAAARCRRRAKPACTLEKAHAALALLAAQAGPADPAPAPALTPLETEALVLSAESLALLDRADEAVAACLTVLERVDGWRPPPDADPRLATACETARRRRLVAQLPATLEVGELPPPPLPDPRSLLPAPVLYEPTISPEDVVTPTRWRISLGGGIGFIMPKTDETYDLGPTASFEVAYDIWGPLSIWGQVTLSLLSLDSRVPVEPGFGRGLTVTSGVVGVMASYPVLDWLDLVGAVGVGAGGFGVQDPGEAAGLALHADLGARFKFDRHLGVRIDAVPMLIVPLGGPAGPDGHISLLLRGEIRF